MAQFDNFTWSGRSIEEICDAEGHLIAGTWIEQTILVSLTIFSWYMQASQETSTGEQTVHTSVVQPGDSNGISSANRLKQGILIMMECIFNLIRVVVIWD